jgi:aspartyl-tRNA synthetase
MEALGNWTRTCYCGDVSEQQIGQTVTVMGWVDRLRDLGNLVFVDLRDRTGILQIVVSSDDQEIHQKAKATRPEFVIAVSGEVVKRDEETINPAIPTGKLEVRASEYRILNSSLTPPFPVNEEITTAEETRLRYRFLDLRRRPLQENIQLRHKACLEIRKFLDENGFLEIETPFLTKSTPEGARDYLVPSRIHRGQFYALPQSPQLFKQLLMIASFDRYYQIVRCFRDEDLRADRQPEFTQVDIELSFPQIDTVFSVVEPLLARVFDLVGFDIALPFPRITFQEAMDRFGTDRPDLRFDLELNNVTSVFEETPFEVFREVVKNGGTIRGIAAPENTRYSRKDLDNLVAFVQQFGAPALSWLRREGNEFKSSLPKAVPQEELQRVAEKVNLKDGQTFLMVAAAEKVVFDSLAALRLHLARQENLVPDNVLSFLWVYDFPLLDWDEEESRFVACHHPFTSPRDEDLELLSEEPGAVRAKAYDVVLNGIEIGGGSIRIHQEAVQKQVFRSLNIGEAEAEERFGFLLEALRYGAPPHGGIALGLDRILMLLAGEHSIREVIAFPKTARAVDLMCAAPSSVSDRQLRELHLSLKKM